MISSARSQSAETQWPLSGRLVQKRALTGAGAQPVQIQVSHLLSKEFNIIYTVNTMMIMIMAMMIMAKMIMITTMITMLT